MIGFQLSVQSAQARFFDRKAVTDRLTKAERRVFGRVGANTRRTAKSSMKPASKRLLKQVRQLSARIRRARGQKRTALIAERKQLQARLHSRPGQAPKRIQGELAKFLFFAMDTNSKSVVIGPSRLGSSNVGPTLEYGGKVRIGPETATIEARPFMGPAAVKQYPTLPALWRDAL